MKNETNIAKKEEAGALAVNMFEADANAGSQNIGQDDVALPFLKVLGQLSPEINKKHAKYVEGAEPGMILNSVTKELFDGDKGIEVIPVFYNRKYLEWQDRGEGVGAPVNIFAIDDPIVKTTKRDQFNRDRLSNGNYLENTANHFVVQLGQIPTSALISMTRTQLKVSRTWNSMMMSIKLQGKNGLFTPPTFSHIYKLKSVQMTNDKGTWFGWDVSKVGPVSDKGVYKLAKDFAEKVGKGEVEIKHETDTETTEKSPY